MIPVPAMLCARKCFSSYQNFRRHPPCMTNITHHEWRRNVVDGTCLLYFLYRICCFSGFKYHKISIALKSILKIFRGGLCLHRIITFFRLHANVFPESQQIGTVWTFAFVFDAASSTGRSQVPIVASYGATWPAFLWYQISCAVHCWLFCVGYYSRWSYV